MGNKGFEEKSIMLDWLDWSVVIATIKFLFMVVVLTLKKIVSFFWVPKEKSLEDEVILITGSANGLGKEICLELASSGASLVLWDVASEENANVARKLRDLGVKRVIETTVDVSDRDKIKEAAFKLRHELGPVTMLVNNAGIAPMTSFFQMKPEAIQKTFGVNVLAQFWTLQEFLPDMIKMNKGHIVTICSTLSVDPMRGCAPYTASKHAIHGLIESLKDELHHLGNCENIKFTSVYPFFIRTNLVDESHSGLRLKFTLPWVAPFLEADVVARRIVEAVKRDQETLILPDHFEFYHKILPFIPREVHEVWIDYIVKEFSFVKPKSLDAKKFSTDRREDIALTKEKEATSKSY